MALDLEPLKHHPHRECVVIRRGEGDSEWYEAVPRSLRHRGTKTTEKHCAQVRPEKALDEVRRALARVSRMTAQPSD